VEVCGYQSGMPTFLQVGHLPTTHLWCYLTLFFYRRAMMEKEDEGAGEEDGEVMRSDTKG
jgi:hypothetical protein